MKNLLILFTLLTLGCSGSDNPSGSNDGSNGEKVQKTVTKHIKVDQFGYLPEQTKIAIITDPKIGFNANSTYSPSNELEVRKTADDTLVYTGSVTPFNNGLTDTDSGDKIWHFDFT
ncbi:cellulase N-terminal Ig-like domain-containing protein, partial [Oceanospirillum sp. HFRX-1_2]